MHMFKNLLEPIQINAIQLKNRMVASPVTTNFATPDGQVTDKLLNFYKERASGGAGLVIVEGTFIHLEGKGYLQQLGIYDDSLIPSLTRLADAIHEGGSLASIQIQHVGRRTSSKITGHRPKAPSAIPCYTGGEVPEALSSEGIQQIIESHAMAALRAKKAGFDSVDIHAAHGYLIPSFFSPLSNKRGDDYGGALKNRVRIAVEIIQRIKTVAGRDFPVTMKISGDEYAEGGLSLEDMLQIVPLLEEAGIDAITVSAGTVTTQEAQLDLACPHRFVRTLPMGTAQGCFSDLAAAVRKKVTVPVMAVGRINTPFVGEQLLREKKADLIGLGRALLADPFFPKKTIAGKPETIRPCIGCNQGCFGRLFVQKELACMVNPTIGREGEDLKKNISAPSKKVWIIGGGPAGLEAARVASTRGNDVTLFDEKDSLGGQLLLAAIPPDREEFKRIIDYEKKVLEKEGVAFRLSTHVDKQMIIDGRPDTIVLATGATPLTPPIKGITGKNVLYAWDVLQRDKIEGKKVIVIGGGLVGCETAEYLAAKGNQVSIIEMVDQIASDAIGDNCKFLVAKITRHGVTVRTQTAAKEIKEDGVLCTTNDGKEEFIEAQIIVLALGSKPRNELMSDLDINPKTGFFESDGHRIKILKAGDCVSVRTALEAFSDGYGAGLDI